MTNSTSIDTSEDGTWVRGGYSVRPATPDIERATESLETELKEVSDRIAVDPLRFQQIRDELARRHAVKDDQPATASEEPTADKDACELADKFLQAQSVLTNKIITMEMQQAELVVEAEVAKAGRLEAERRLALLAENTSKMRAAERVPLTREAAIDLCRTHMNKLFGIDDTTSTPADWAIDAVVKASR